MKEFLKWLLLGEAIGQLVGWSGGWFMAFVIIPFFATGRAPAEIVTKLSNGALWILPLTFAIFSPLMALVVSNEPVVSERKQS